MTTLIRSLLAITLFAGSHSHCLAQTTNTTTDKLSMGKVEPYEVQVTFNKTVHLIFPAAIRYVDLGSEYLIAGKAEDAENVLRVKATVKDFTEATNFSVITSDGRFYNFNVFYSPNPASLNYDLVTMQKVAGKVATHDVLLEELGDSSPSLTELLLETIYKKDKRIVKHIGSRSYGIQFLLKGIYVEGGKFYFHTELRNKSNVPFKIDFIHFKIVDKKVAKRTVVQEKPLNVLRMYKPLDAIAGNSADQNVFLLDQFTIGDDKLLIIELFEKNGGRQQMLLVENSDLVHARQTTDMHLKIQ